MPHQPVNEIRFDKRMSGKIARLNKGFGFIEGEDGKDYFFHWTELSKFSKHFRNLAKDDKVTFQPGKTDDGPRAFAVETSDESLTT